METKVAVIGIIVEYKENIPELNSILSEFGKYIIGRMGIPHTTKNVNLISIAMDAPEEVIESFNQRIEKLEGINAKTVVCK